MTRMESALRATSAGILHSVGPVGHGDGSPPSGQQRYHKIDPDHAKRYLASFAWRYNRRYQLQTMIPRFLPSAARTSPMPYRTLIAG